jgi:transcriptional regulator with XRE-family HTH domain
MQQIAIAENIKKLRKSTGYHSSRALNLALHDVGYFCSDSLIGHWECGDRLPTLDAVAALCEVLNVTADELIFQDKTRQDS